MEKVEVGHDFGRWRDLPADIFACIISHLMGLSGLRDRVILGAVCKHWRYALKLQHSSSSSWVWMVNSFPNPNGPMGYKTFSLTDGVLYPLHHIPDGTRFCGSYQQWLVATNQDKDTFFLFNPFTAIQIPLPDLKSNPNYNSKQRQTGFIRKAVLSSSPDFGGHNDDIIIAALHNSTYLSVCRLTASNYFPTTPSNNFEDIIFYRGMLFAVNCSGKVHVIELSNEDLRIVTKFKLRMEYITDGRYWFYLVESGGKLLVVGRRAKREKLTGFSYYYFSTTGFKVFELQSNRSLWVEVKSLGGDALFIGASGSKSVRAAEYGGVEADHIYFTDDSLILDSGVFSMKDRRITPIPHTTFTSKLTRFQSSRSRMCLPMWLHLTCA